MIDSCYVGDVRDGLRAFISAGHRAQTCITSPPYWGLRDYGVAGQLGLERSPTEWVECMVEVFRLVRDAITVDGTLWLQVGDCWRDKQLVPQSWMLAIALQADGWILRQCIVWQKPAPMPETVRDRCTNAHEYLFLLARGKQYFFDASVMREPTTGNAHGRGNGVNPKAMPPVAGHAHGSRKHCPIEHAKKDAGRVEQGLRDSTKFGRGAAWRARQNESFSAAVAKIVEDRNRRSVWTIAAEPTSDAHFATFPTALVEPCILAGSRPGDIVLDPFLGSGTTAMVAQSLGRHWFGTELNESYVAMQRQRTAQLGMELSA